MMSVFNERHRLGIDAGGIISSISIIALEPKRLRFRDG